MKSLGTMRDYLKAVARHREPRGISSCLDDSQVVSFYSRQLDAGEAETICAHLADCPRCLALARDARQFLRLMTGPVEVVAIRPKSMSAQGSGRPSGWSPGQRSE